MDKFEQSMQISNSNPERRPIKGENVHDSARKLKTHWHELRKGGMMNGSEKQDVGKM